MKDCIYPRMPETRNWGKIAATYTRPSWRRTIIQLLDSGVPFVALWILAYQSLAVGYWLTLLLGIAGGGFLVRLFIIQHDCGHGSFSPSQRFNNALGRVIGVLTVTPYSYWRRIHSIHHATTGDLDNRICGDISTITVREYLARGTWGRLGYRIFRNPILLFGIGPPYQFLIKHRFPYEGLPAPKGPGLRSALGTDLALLAVLAVLHPLIGWKAALMVHVPMVMTAAVVGVWFFYVQHNFEQTYWRRHDEWSYSVGALEGSSYYALPKWLQWISGNIGIHHVHHLRTRIPNYRLQEMLDDYPELGRMNRLTLLPSFRCALLALWDEDRGQMISFRELDRRQLEPAGATAPSS